MAENTLNLEAHLLVCIEVDDTRSSAVKEENAKDYEYLKANFCGQVLCVQDKKDLDHLKFETRPSNGITYVCGNIESLLSKQEQYGTLFKIIKELSFGYDASEIDGSSNTITLGEVPINLHNIGVYYRNVFSPKPASPDTNKSYFDALQEKHKFQGLTESNKPGTSFRKGVYLSQVDAVTDSEDKDALKFNLLRCSTNLDGPTVAFADEDREILHKINELARHNFQKKVDLNHVLAQVYENSITVDPESNKSKEHKARIKSHSDKTKDMPADGLIVFCTFYSSDITKYKASAHDRFDRVYKGSSVFSQLRFRLKEEAYHLPLAKDFRVTLYPDSVFFIPLSTNRFYTHETCPPTLPPGRFPTRLGYVARCSKTKAVFRDGHTFIHRTGKEDVKLEEPTTTDREELKKLYQAENLSTKPVEYKDIFFSLNNGDYTRPLVK